MPCVCRHDHLWVVLNADNMCVDLAMLGDVQDERGVAETVTSGLQDEVLV